MTEADDAVDDASLDNPTIPAGYTYFGQFIDHDLTFDPSPACTRQNDPDALTDFRTPALRPRLRLRPRARPTTRTSTTRRPAAAEAADRPTTTTGADLPRNAAGRRALIGDPRNDENIFVSQLQLAILKFHNRWSTGSAGDSALTRQRDLFEAAQRIVRWHYQWVVLHDFLPRIVGAETLAARPRGDRPHHGHAGLLPWQDQRRTCRSSSRWRPTASGTRRSGPSYKLNTLVGPLPTFLPGETNDEALKIRQFGGFRELPAFWTIEWKRFFEVQGEGDGQLQHSRLIDTQLSNPLKNLPKEIGGDAPSLILRNLTRAARLALPSGQAVAAAMGIPALSDDDLGLPGGGPSPLWYYILRKRRSRPAGTTSARSAAGSSPRCSSG